MIRRQKNKKRPKFKFWVGPIGLWVGYAKESILTKTRFGIFLFQTSGLSKWTFFWTAHHRQCRVLVLRRDGPVRAPSQTVDQVPSLGAVLLLERLPELGPVAGLERYQTHDGVRDRLAVRPGHEKTERGEPFSRRRIRLRTRQDGDYRHRSRRQLLRNTLSKHINNYNYCNYFCYYYYFE